MRLARRMAEFIPSPWRSVSYVAIGGFVVASVTIFGNSFLSKSGEHFSDWLFAVSSGSATDVTILVSASDSPKRQVEALPAGIQDSVLTIPTLSRYAIDASIHVPRVAVEWLADVTLINSRLQKIVADEVFLFVEEPNGSDERRGSVEVDYRVTLFKRNLISVLFETSSYFEGAAHPQHSSQGVTFVLTPPIRLNLDELFPDTPAHEYLPRLSTFCISALKEKLLSTEEDAEARTAQIASIEEGAGQKAIPTTPFVLTDDAIRFVFDEYSVAPYVAGRHAVDVPFDAIKDLLGNDSPIMVLFKQPRVPAG